MDLSNIKGLLETNESLDLSDNDLEDELNAIINGQAFSVRPKQTTTKSGSGASGAHRVPKRVKQNDTKQSKTQNTSKSQTKLSDEHKDFKFSEDLLNFDKIGIIGDLDEDMDDEDIDEDNEDLLSEISAIASDKTSVNKNKNDYKTDKNKYDFSALNSMQLQNKNISEEKQIHSQQIDVKKSINNSSDSYPISSKPLIDTKSVETRPSNINQLIPSVRNQDIETNQNIKENKITDNKNEIPRLNALKDQYKRAALTAKQSGQQTTALSHIKTAKQIEVLVKALEDGMSVDLSQLPPPPLISNANNEQNVPKPSSEPLSQTNSNQEIDFGVDLQNVELTTEDAKKFFNAPPPPNTVMEALEQRLAKFKSTLNQANEENNSSKVRRLGRIVKQYENAIKDLKKGKTMDFDELPTPPGFGPIPVPSKQINTTSEQTTNVVNPVPKPNIPTKPANNSVPIVNKSPQSVAKPTIETTPPKVSQKPYLKRASSSANKQLNYLLERQRLFKEAALESKQKGDIQQAKEYLRMAKGFEPLIEATQNGLPIDATSIPTPPQMNDDFVIVSHPEASEGDDMEREEMFRKIEVELQNQIEMCKRNKEYFLQLADISSASKFEKYVTDSRKDLDLLTVRWKSGQKLPNFKYEMRTFSIVICNTEVGTNEVSLEVVKALDIPAKNDVDTYVRIEFPFPNVSDKTQKSFCDRVLTKICGKQDNKQMGRTKTIKNSINPVFNETFKFQIDRKSRQLPRVFKRHPLKLELMSKGGFLRNDTLIGTALIKLTDFETKCTIHESFVLTEGRKIVGGKIEAKVKIREPLLAKQVEEIKEKWLTSV